MSTYFFKTNIHCTKCVAQIRPLMERMELSGKIDRWQVDLNSSDHVLEVETQKLSPEQVKHYIREAGFEADFTTPPQSRVAGS